jgi:hypothetical protein
MTMTKPPAYKTFYDVYNGTIMVVEYDNKPEAIARVIAENQAQRTSNWTFRMRREHDTPPTVPVKG